MISNDFNTLGLPPIRHLDEHTKFFICGSLTDRASGTSIENHGLESDGRYIYAPASAPSSYAAISGSGLGSDVIVSGSVPWTVEIEFHAPEWNDMTADVACIFGYAEQATRFDILVQKATHSIAIGGKLDGVTGVVPGRNLFVVQKDASGNWNWLLNGEKNGSAIGSMQARGSASPLILWEGRTSTRYGAPFKIRWIRISNCLRLS